MKDWDWNDPRLANPGDDNSWTYFKLDTTASPEKGIIVKMSTCHGFEGETLQTSLQREHFILEKHQKI